MVLYAVEWTGLNWLDACSAVRVAVGRVGVRGGLHQPGGVRKPLPKVVNLDPWDESEEKEDDAGGHLLARQQVPSLLAELQVHQEYSHGQSGVTW